MSDIHCPSLEYVLKTQISSQYRPSKKYAGWKNHSPNIGLVMQWNTNGETTKNQKESLHSLRPSTAPPQSFTIGLSDTLENTNKHELHEKVQLLMIMLKNMKAQYLTLATSVGQQNILIKNLTNEVKVLHKSNVEHFHSSKNISIDKKEYNVNLSPKVTKTNAIKNLVISKSDACIQSELIESAANSQSQKISKIDWEMPPKSNDMQQNPSKIHRKKKTKSRKRSGVQKVTVNKKIRRRTSKPKKSRHYKRKNSKI